MHFAASAWRRCDCIPKRSVRLTKMKCNSTARSSPSDWLLRGSRASVDLPGMIWLALAGLQVRAGAKERHKGHLFSMYVDAAHRRSGLSEQLVKAVISGARDASMVLMHLSVTSSNTNAKRFYRRWGSPCTVSSGGH